MTTRGRSARPRDGSHPAYSTPVPTSRHAGPQIHVIGTSAEVDRLISRVTHVVDVVKASPKVPRRDNTDHVIVYLDVE